MKMCSCKLPGVNPRIDDPAFVFVKAVFLKRQRALKTAIFKLNKIKYLNFLVTNDCLQAFKSLCFLPFSMAVRHGH